MSPSTRHVSTEANTLPHAGGRGPPDATIRGVGSPVHYFLLAGPKESTSDVTSAQRARLVLALGVLNLVLASFALAVGIVGPRQPDQGVAGVDRSSPPSSSAPSPEATQSSPVAIVPSTPGPSIESGSPVPTSTPSVEPSAIASPIVEPSPSEVVVAVVPTPTPTTSGAGGSGNGPSSQPATIPGPPVNPILIAAPLTPRPTPTPARATPPPTPRPTPQATSAPTAKPVTKPVRARPPCPGSVDGAPGHNKTNQADRPCKSHGHHAKGSTGGKAKGGFVIVLPQVAGTLLGIGRRPGLRPLRRRLPAR